MIILKVTKNQGVTFSLENPFLEKIQNGEIGGRGFKLTQKHFKS